jgi:exosome complex RNA-binding protein Csl4
MRFTCLLLLCATGLVAADGTCKGKWSSSQNGNGGEIRIQVKPEAGVVFTLNGQEVKTRVVSVKQEGTAFSIAYEFEFDSYKLRSSLSGIVKESKIEGGYKTVTTDGVSPVDEGSFQCVME